MMPASTQGIRPRSERVGVPGLIVMSAMRVSLFRKGRAPFPIGSVRFETVLSSDNPKRNRNSRFQIAQERRGALLVRQEAPRRRVGASFPSHLSTRKQLKLRVHTKANLNLSQVRPAGSWLQFSTSSK